MPYIDETGTYKSASDWNTGTGGSGGGTLPVVAGDPSLNPYFPPQSGSAERYMIHDGKLYVAALRGTTVYDGHGTPNSTSGDSNEDTYKGVDNWVEWTFPVGDGESTPPQSEESRVHDGWFTHNSRFVLFDDGNLWVWGNSDHGDHGIGVADSNTNNPILLDTNVYSIAKLPGGKGSHATSSYGNTHGLWYTKARKYTKRYDMSNVSPDQDNIYSSPTNNRSSAEDPVLTEGNWSWVYWKPTDLEARTGSYQPTGAVNAGDAGFISEDDPLYGISAICYVGYNGTHAAGTGVTDNITTPLRRTLYDLEDDINVPRNGTLHGSFKTKWPSGTFKSGYYHIRQVYQPMGHHTGTFVVIQNRTDGRVYHILTCGRNDHGQLGVDYYDPEYTTSGYVKTFRVANDWLPNWETFGNGRQQEFTASEPVVLARSGHTSTSTYTLWCLTMVYQQIIATDHLGTRRRLHSLRAAGDGEGNNNCSTAASRRSNTNVIDVDYDYKTFEYVSPDEDPAGSFNYDRANADAIARGGELAIFNSPYERERCQNMLFERWVKNTTGQAHATYATDEDFQHAWVGCLDKKHEGIWEWEDGSWADSRIIRFLPSQPDNASTSNGELNMMPQPTDPEVVRSEFDYRATNSSFGGRIFDTLTFNYGTSDLVRTLVSCIHGDVMQVDGQGNGTWSRRLDVNTTDIETTEKYTSNQTSWLAKRYSGGKFLHLSDGKILYARCWPRKDMQGDSWQDFHVHGMEMMLSYDHGVTWKSIYTNEQFDEAARKFGDERTDFPDSGPAKITHWTWPVGPINVGWKARSGTHWNYFRDRENPETSRTSGFLGSHNEIMITSLCEVNSTLGIPGTVLMTTTSKFGAMLWRSFSFGQRWECLGHVETWLEGNHQDTLLRRPNSFVGGVHKAIIQSDEGGTLLMAVARWDDASGEDTFISRHEIWVSVDHGETWAFHALINSQTEQDIGSTSTESLVDVTEGASISFVNGGTPIGSADNLIDLDYPSSTSKFGLYGANLGGQGYQARGVDITPLSSKNESRIVGVSFRSGDDWSNHPTRYPVKFWLYGRDSTSDEWTLIYTESSLTQPTSNYEKITYMFNENESSTQKFTYYRLTFWHGGADGINLTNAELLRRSGVGYSKLGLFKHVGKNTFIGTLGVSDPTVADREGRASWVAFRGIADGSDIPWSHGQGGYTWSTPIMEGGAYFGNYIQGSPLGANWHALSTSPSTCIRFGTHGLLIPGNLEWNQSDHNNVPIFYSLDNGATWKIKWYAGDSGASNDYYHLTGNVWMDACWQNTDSTISGDERINKITFLRSSHPVSTDVSGQWAQHTGNERITAYTLDFTSEWAGTPAYEASNFEKHAHIAAHHFMGTYFPYVCLNDMGDFDAPSWGEVDGVPTKFGYILMKRVNVSGSTAHLARDAKITNALCTVEVQVPGVNYWQVLSTASGTGTGRHKNSFNDDLLLSGLSQAIRLDNRVFTWGYNSHQECGRFDRHDGVQYHTHRWWSGEVLHPDATNYQIIQQRPRGAWKRLWGHSATGHHMNYFGNYYAVDANDKLYGWGYNGGTMLGNKPNTTEPSLISSPKDWSPNLDSRPIGVEHTTSSSAYYDNFALIPAADGSLWGLGQNYNDAVAHGSARSNFHKLTKIKSPVV